MSYTKKQRLFAEFMLKKIGLINEQDITHYLNYLSNIYGRMVSFPNSNYYSGFSWHYSVSECIDLLKQEIEIKKDKGTIKPSGSKSLISATDLSSYEYCPASYAIRNSFIIENPSGEEFTDAGKQFHEQLLLLTKRESIEPVTDFSFNTNDLSVIRKSKLIFSGHDDNKRTFLNNNWVGAPDYIMQDKANDFFVVEEKFHKRRDPNKVTSTERFNIIFGDGDEDEEAEEQREKWKNYNGYFFSNHIVQLVSYIKNIQEYSLKYGYLVYWYYDYNEQNQPYIHKVVTKKVYLDTETENLYMQSFNGVQELRNNKKSVFAIDKLNMRKCAACVVNKYCGHKTKRFETLTFPYSSHFLNLFYIPFPEELKKTN